MPIKTEIKSKLLQLIDTTCSTVWAKRSREAVGKTDKSSQAVQTIAMMLVQLAHINVMNSTPELDDIRLLTIERYAPHLPLQYQFAVKGGCMGSEAVSQAETEFATETVLAALTEHHGLEQYRLTGALKTDWEQNVLPKLQAAVHAVLESRNAGAF